MTTNIDNININIIADYGGESRNTGDLAFHEVKRVFRDLLFHASEIDIRPTFETISVGAFNTTEAAFVLAQQGLNQRHGCNDVYFVNVAPRKDDPNPRARNAGEGLVVGVLPSGAAVFAVNSGYTLHFLSEAGVQFYAVKGDGLNDGSQFRSRDTFPKPAVELIRHHFEENLSFADILSAEGAGKWFLRGDKVDKKSIPTIAPNTILYIDGYGNTKVNLTPEQLETFGEIKGVIHSSQNNPKPLDIATGNGIFAVKDGQAIIAPGSSGWNNKQFCEVVVRGGNAAAALGNPKPGEIINLITSAGFNGPKARIAHRP